MSYGAGSRVSEIMDPAGGATSWSYQGRLAATGSGSVLVQDPGGDRGLFSYRAGRLMSVAMAVGTGSAATTTYAYVKGTGEVASVVDPDGSRAAFGYDAAGDLLTASEPGAAEPVISYRYNRLGEVTAETTAPGQTTRYAYDSAGNLRSATDAGGDKTAYRYGGRPGEVTSVTDPAGHTTAYGYDTAGDIVAVHGRPAPRRS